MSTHNHRSKRVKKAEEELSKRINEEFPPPSKSFIALGCLIFLIHTSIRIGIFLCQVYSLLIGSSIIWAGISSVFRGQPSFTYAAGYSNPLMFFQLNSGLGAVCVGLGILYSVIKGWKKVMGTGLSILIAVLFGLPNLIVGLMSLLGIDANIGITLSGWSGVVSSILIGYSIVVAVMQSWKGED